MPESRGFAAEGSVEGVAGPVTLEKSRVQSAPRSVGSADAEVTARRGCRSPRGTLPDVVGCRIQGLNTHPILELFTTQEP